MPQHRSSSRQPLIPATSSPSMSLSRDSPNPPLKPCPHSTSARRMKMFICAVLVGLASGSNYVYSGYAPQLAASLKINSTQANLIGVAGNLGMYLSGPLWGRIVDAHGPRVPLLSGFILTLTGYSFLRLFLFNIIPVQSTILFPGIAMFLTGIGGSAGLSSSVNAAAKSFPDHLRASATGAVLAGFGLSAFTFSLASQVFFHGEASGLLLLLSLGTSLPMLLGFFMVRPIPLDPEPELQLDVHDEDQIPRRGLLQQEDQENQVESTKWLIHRDHGSLELSRSSSPDYNLEADQGSGSGGDHRQALTTPLLEGHDKTESTQSALVIAYTPLDLIRLVDFHLLFIVLALLCGVGLEWINNVGAVTLALARDGWDYNPRVVSAYQAKQVASISILNCTGRIVGGLVSDFFKAKFGLKRIWFLPVVAFMFLLSQLFALDVTNVSTLFLVSASLGLAYGSLFNVVPMLVLEWFGMKHFSQNYGWTCVAPVIGGNAFNLLFGRIYDSHSVTRESEGGLGRETEMGVETVKAVVRAVSGKRDGGISTSGGHQCLVRRECYADALKFSALGCVVALALSIVMGLRRERTMESVRKRSRSTGQGASWEGED